MSWITSHTHFVNTAAQRKIDATAPIIFAVSVQVMAAAHAAHPIGNTVRVMCEHAQIRDCPRNCERQAVPRETTGNAPMSSREGAEPAFEPQVRRPAWTGSLFFRAGGARDAKS